MGHRSGYGLFTGEGGLDWERGVVTAGEIGRGWANLFMMSSEIAGRGSGGTWEPDSRTLALSIEAALM
jgi:hypothetical protein